MKSTPGAWCHFWATKISILYHSYESWTMKHLENNIQKIQAGLNKWQKIIYSSLEHKGKILSFVSHFHLSLLRLSSHRVETSRRTGFHIKGTIQKYYLELYFFIIGLAWCLFFIN
jgi:hypothetical protein